MKTHHQTAFALGGVVAMMIWTLPVTQAATVTYKNGATTPFWGGAYAGTDDNTLLLQGGNSNDNWGGRQIMQVGYSGADARKPIIRFNVTSLAGQYSAITSVQLRLYVNTAPSASQPDTIQVFPLTVANSNWSEGTLGGGAQTGSSCWAAMQYGGTGWAGTTGASTAGIDFTTPAVASAPISSANVAYSAVTLNISDLALVAQWVSGNNPGLILTGTTSGAKSVWPAFWTSEAATIGAGGYEPELIINYTPVPEPAIATLLGAVLAVMFCVRRQFC